MTKTHIAIAAAVLSAGFAAYLFLELNKCKEYIKAGSPGGATANGMPPANWKK